MNIKISIIIPIYNAKKYLAETIDSVIKQTYHNWELILVDDGSTDESYSIAKGYENYKVKVFGLENGGACQARNFGFTKSTGDYIQYFDADDLMQENLLEEKVKVFNRIKRDVIVISAYYRFVDDIEEIQLLAPSIYRNYQQGIDLIIDMASKWQFLQVSSFMFPRNLQLQSGNWDNSLLRNQDGEFFNRLLLVCEGVEFCGSTRSYYRDSPKSISKRKSSETYLSIFQSYEKYEKIILTVEDSARTRKALVRYYSNIIYRMGNRFPQVKDCVVNKTKSLGYGPMIGGKLIYKMACALLGFNFFIKISRKINKPQS